MKRITLLLAAVGTLALSSCSCKKKEPGTDVKVTQTVDVTINENSSYTYQVPDNKSDDPYAITADAKHASVSTLTGEVNVAPAYSYTPVRGFVGTDQVIIENVEEQHNDQSGEHHDNQILPGGCMNQTGCTEHHHHGCGHDDSQISRTIIINIHIVSVPGKAVETLQ
jgi:hypothetical protein